MKKYILDGSKINNLNDFFKQFGEMVNGPGGYFGKDLASFDDCLFGGYGLEGDTIIFWKNSDISKNIFDHEALNAWSEEQIQMKNYLDEEGLSYFKNLITTSLKGEGPSLFDIILESIQSVEKRTQGKMKILVILD